MKTLRSAVCACLVCFFAADKAGAQADLFTDLAKNFSDLAIQWGPFFPKLNQIHPESDSTGSWLGAFGAEFIFDITRVSTRREKKVPGCEKVLVRGEPKERQVKATSTGVDSTDVFNVKNACKEPKPNLELELGLGFFQTSRFRVNDQIGAMTGVFREAPAVSVYVSALNSWALQPYGALRTGLTELLSPSLEDPAGKFFSATASRSFEIGGVVGVGFAPWRGIPANIFVEGAWMYRPITGITWDVAAPKGARRRLDFSGMSASVGLQIMVKDPKKK